MLGVEQELEALSALVQHHDQVLVGLLAALRRAACKTSLAHNLTEINIIAGTLEERIEDLRPKLGQDLVDSPRE